LRLRLVICRLWLMICRLWLVVYRLRLVICRLGRRVVGRRGRGRSITFSRGAVDVVLVVTGAKVLVEEGSVPAVVGVLLPVRVAEVVDLTTGLWVGVVPPLVWLASAVEPCVRLRHRDRQRLH